MSVRSAVAKLDHDIYVAGQHVAACTADVTRFAVALIAADSRLKSPSTEPGHGSGDSSPTEAAALAPHPDELVPVAAKYIAAVERGDYACAAKAANEIRAKVLSREACTHIRHDLCCLWMPCSRGCGRPLDKHAYGGMCSACHKQRQRVA